MKPAHASPRSCAIAAALLFAIGSAQAFTFETENVRGSFDSSVTLGLGIRARSPSSSLVTSGATGPNAPAGALVPEAQLGDQGNLNYGKGDFFAGQLKGNHELLLKLPSQVTFMARANWVRDFTATHTTGILSATSPVPPVGPDGLSDSARSDLRFKGRLLDLWVSKGFEIGGQQARVRVGNQVVSWGESLFLPGGINSTNAMDIMRLSQPGTQLKEVFLPAPMVSFATGLGHGLNMEAYYQTHWNRSYFPPTGSYWSVVNGLGPGHEAYGLFDKKAPNGGQFGAALRYEPEDTQLNLGFYAMQFHDKTPNFMIDYGTGDAGWTYAGKRRLIGVSANFPLGDWAVGTELSYRPKDAVALNANATGCASQGGKCWVDAHRLQWHLTGLLSLTPSGTGAGVLKLLGADTATLLAETVVIHYPGLKKFYGGDPISAGGWGWGQVTDSAGTPTPSGTKTSAGINFDFSVVYDGTIIPGWQVTPGIYYFHAVAGRTPNASGLFMQGARSANLYVSFTQNPANWQITANYGRFWGGHSPLDQPLKDRTFFGFALTRNF